MPDLADIRAEISLLKGERSLLMRQGRAEVAQRVDALVEHYVHEGEKLARRAAEVAAAGGAFDPFAVYVAGHRVDLGPLLGALLTPTVLKRAVMLSTLPVHPAGRATKLREIDDMLDDLERQEEALVVELGADRRPDVRPEIVVG